ncbi:MAG: preprotein translocase subunit YajC [Rickettsiales bacterium]|jgi:preprotein translocase subunit YajC|nr:preprotein translocase subunit YajC [Rickettsiales bacterium]
MDEVAQPNSWGLVLNIVLLFAVVWFLIIRPGRKRAQETAEMQGALKVGDRVIVAGGLIGDIKKLGKDKISVELTKGVVVEVLRQSVIGLDK